MPLVIGETLAAEVVDEAILAEQPANFLSMPGTGRPILAVLAALELFVESCVGEEVGMIGIAVFLALHDRYRC